MKWAFLETQLNKNNAEVLFLKFSSRRKQAALNGSFDLPIYARPISASELQTIIGLRKQSSEYCARGNNIPTQNIIAAYEPGDLRKDASIGNVIPCR